MTRLWVVFFHVASLVVLLRGSTSPALAAEGPSPEQVASTLEMRGGYRVTLAAAEPLIGDPVSARLDRRGRLWVVEMPDYPTGPRGGEPPAGRLRVLSDSDGDGRFDEATTFADRLPFATGVQPYRGGAIVTLAGKIEFFADTDNDGVADRREVWFRGFATGNEQLRANHPRLGPDGMVYVAGGLRGGKITAVSPRFDQTAEPVDLRDADFCFDPDGGAWKAVTGKSQHGLSIDDFGRRVGCSNRNPAMCPPLAIAAVERDPLLARRDAVADIAAAAARSRVEPIADAWTTSNLHAGQFSAACGVVAPGISRDSGGEWLLVCEPTGSLVQRQSLARHRSVWQSQRESETAEFLAARHNWFRPVDLAVGAGGDLYVVDMARAVIEHPDWMPDELKQRSDLWDGQGLGRIWRVTRAGVTPSVRPIDSPPSALAALRSPFAWQRRAASEYFLESGIDESAEPLRQLLLDPEASPAGRARGSMLLARYGVLTPHDLESLLSDRDARLRALAVRLSLHHPQLFPAVAGRSEDDDPLVRREVAAACAAGKDRPELRAGALAAMATRDIDDLWIRRTIGSAHEGLLEPLVRRWLAVAEDQTSAAEVTGHLVRRLCRRAPDVAADAIQSRLSAAADAGNAHRVAIAALRGWQLGAGDRKASVAAATEALPDQSREAIRRAERWVAEIALDRTADESLRVACISVVDRSGKVPETFRDLLSSDQPPAIRRAAIGLLLRHDRTWAHRRLAQWIPEMTVASRRAVVTAAAANPADIKWLFALIGDGVLTPGAIDPATANRFKKHPDASIRKLAGKWLTPSADRQEVLEKYASAAELLGDAVAGRKRFNEHCAACHRVGESGVNVGPDISDSRRKTPAALLTAILDPNRAIDAAYTRYTVLTVDGQIIDGLLAAESKDAVTLDRQEGKRIRIPRERIEEAQVPGASLMPEGFESVLSVEQMSDLLAYLKYWRYLDSDIPIPVAETP